MSALLQAGLILMIVGMSTVFISLGIFYVIIIFMGKTLKGSGEKNLESAEAG